MEAANLHKTTPPAGPGDLVLQNGRQAGTRRPLGTPTTFIGRTQGCDIRLNVDGVDPMHCVLIPRADGIHLRDLNSAQGTSVNGEQVESALLCHGDLLKVGPFEFRVELPPAPPKLDDAPIDELRAAARIQAAAVAAQQIALEEEELRLQKRHADMQEQEEQLAAHLAEKQRQVQLWSEYTQTERETLRKEKLEVEKHRSKLEAELGQAKTEVSRDQQKLAQARQHINQIYQRLKLRWRKQWAAEKEKYLQQARELQVDVEACKERQELLRVQEAALEREVVRFSTDRELSTRQLQEGRTNLSKEQESWRRRRSLEMLALKTKARDLDDAQLKLKQARQLLVDEKEAWDRQLEAMRKELHGLNNRIVHQRQRVEEQGAEIARLDAVVRQRREDVGTATLAAQPATVLPGEPVPPRFEGEALVDKREDSSTMTAIDNGQLEGLERIANELADQRVHLLEQYARLVEIQDAWQDQHDQACTELETLAQRLLTQEQLLADRERHASAHEASLEQRREEVEAMRQEIQITRAQLRASAELLETDRQKQLNALSQKELLLNEQLAELTQIRQRWNHRRLEETKELRSKQAVLAQQHRDTQEQRLKLFEKGQALEEEKRILAEKSLALEQYRQEVFYRAKDPTAQRRVERLRRRWLTLNTALLRDAKAEREATKKELAQLDAHRQATLQKLNELNEADDALTAKQASLDEREATLKARQLLLDQELAKLESQRRQAEEHHLRMQDEVEALAKAVYAEPEPPAIDKAA